MGIRVVLISLASYVILKRGKLASDIRSVIDSHDVTPLQHCVLIQLASSLSASVYNGVERERLAVTPTRV